MAILIPQDKMFIPYVATAGQTTFAYTWPMYEDSDLTIYKITTAGVISTLTLTTDYTVTGVGTQGGGNVVLVVGALVGENIIVTGNLPESRSSNYTAAGDFTKESVNESFNKVIQIAQQQRRDVDRSIHMNPADPLQIDGVGAIDMKLPLLADRANKYLGFDANGSVQMNDASGVAGPTSSVDNEVALFSGTTGQIIKRPSTASMIIPQGTTAQRDVPTAITLRGNTDGTEDVEAYINGGWQSILTGGTGAPIGATYITQTPSGTLTSEQAMSALATGLVKNTTATGVQSIAVDGTDYISPTLQSNVDVNGNSLVSLANGDITIAPNGTGKTNITSPIVLTSQVAPAHADGTLFYSSTDHCPAFFNDEADITLQVGQENWIRVYNNSGATITNGKIVYVTGQEAVENRLTIGLAQADSAATSKVIGVATHDIENNSFGFITQFGNVNDLNTAAFTAGDPVWLSSSSAGDFTDTEPVAPDSSIFMGFVAESDAGTGKIFITTIGNTSGTSVSGDASQLVTSARKGSAGTINIGDAVYISGYNVGQSVIEVEFADSSTSATMPAIGIASSQITNALTGTVTISGRIGGLDTSAFTAGDELFVSETGTTGNTLTTTKPTGVALIQKMGIVNRSNVNNGVLTIIGAGRSNDIPNFTAADKYWYGAATGTSAEGDITAFGRSLIDDANAAAGATTLGLGTADNVSFLNGDFTGTEALNIPVGTTAQRPGAPIDGDLRINTTDTTTEIYRSGSWRDLEAGSAGAGKILQVQSTTKTDTFQTNSGVFIDITGMSVSITPSATTSTIHIICNLSFAGYSSATDYSTVRLLRGATAISVGASAGSRTQSSIGLPRVATSDSMSSAIITFVDSPATTSSTTYKLQGQALSGGFSINRTYTDSDAAGYIRCASTITVMEIGV